MRVFVAGGHGFLGRRVSKRLSAGKVDFVTKSLRDGLDYTDYDALEDFISSQSIDVILNCAAYVGGIQFGYKHPGEMFYKNMLMTLNFLEISRKFKIKRLVNPISNCAYPAKATLFKESHFWDGALHRSVLAYGQARKASWVGSWAYNKQYGTDWINLIFSNMYGPDDHFDEERSHALGALIMKIVKAKKEGDPRVVIWGTGKPIREWLYVDDAAEAMVRALHVEPYAEPINIGTGVGVSIYELALKIKNIVGYEGELQLDLSKPDGAPHKTVDGSRGQRILNWGPSTSLDGGIAKTLDWYLHNKI